MHWRRSAIPRARPTKRKEEKIIHYTAGNLTTPVMKSSILGVSATLLVFAALLQSAHSTVLKPVSHIIPRCSLSWCSTIGASGSCHILSKPFNRVITCREWSKTRDGKNDCGSFRCDTTCLPEEEQPIDQNGDMHCNPCLFLLASCSSGYKIYAAPAPPRP